MSLAGGRMSVGCSSGSPLNGCVSPICARSCSASRKPDAHTAGLARSMCGSDASRFLQPGPSRARRFSHSNAQACGEKAWLIALLLGAAFPVQMMRRRIALDPDVVHGLRAKLDRALKDPSPVARLAPCAARDQVDVARPALHRPNLLVGANGSDRAD